MAFPALWGETGLCGVTSAPRQIEFSFSFVYFSTCPLLQHQVAAPRRFSPKGCGQARLVLRCEGGAAATSRPTHPAQDPAHSAPVPGGGPRAACAWEERPCSPSVERDRPGGPPRARASTPGQDLRALGARSSRGPGLAWGEPHRQATQGVTPRPEAAPAYLVRLDLGAVQPGRGRDGDAALVGPTPQGRL
ncbi:hypothetical protein NDU88_008788 [Pleurodeles waltl]|uniref:Uncharacterized protein n=1 Tax=Pleurodeles waltl TaxID=8319 RepID=A0AAV7QTU0_PLEWA|nr:hypothetical protein NDU88_008788 [Pleurodeles waltl]